MIFNFCLASLLFNRAYLQYTSHYINLYKELHSQKVPADFGQGVAMQEWHSAATDHLSSSENALQNRLGVYRRLLCVARM